MAIYMKIDGIDGRVTAEGHAKWIELNGLDFGVGRGITSARAGNQTNREASIPSFTQVRVSKEMDETSPLIFTESCIGKSKEIQIHLCRTGDKTQTFMEYTLSGVLISSYQVSTGGDSHPSESMTLNYDKIVMKYTPYNDKHEPGSPVPAGYDLVKAQKV